LSLGTFVNLFSAAMQDLGYGVPIERTLTRQEKTDLAIQRAGTADKSSRAYKSARRTIERRATEAGQRRGQASMRRFADDVRRRGLRVSAVFELDVSPADEDDMRPRELDFRLSGNQLPRTIDALARGNLETAGRAFKDELLAAYMEVGPDEPHLLDQAQIGDVDALDIGWGDEADT